MGRCAESRSCCRFGRCVKRLFLFLFVVALVAVPAAYFLVPKAMKSEWARKKAEQEVSARLGTPVSIGKLEFTWGGGWVAQDVRADAARMGEVTAKWSVREVNLRPKALQLFSKNPKLAATLKEPRLELRWTGEAAPRPLPSLHSPSFARAKGINIYSFRIEKGSVLVEHDGFTQPLLIESIDAAGDLDATGETANLDVKSLKATMHGGTVAASGKIDIRPEGAAGQVALDIRDVEMNQFVVQAIRDLQPMIEVEAGGRAEGKVNLRGEAKAQSSTISGLWHAASGCGVVEIFSADVTRSRIMHAVRLAEDLPHLVTTRFVKMVERFTLGSGVVTIQELLADAESSQGSARITGKVDSNRAIDVSVQLDPTLGRGARGPVRVTGTIEEPVAGRR